MYHASAPAQIPPLMSWELLGLKEGQIHWVIWDNLRQLGVKGVAKNIKDFCLSGLKLGGEVLWDSLTKQNEDKLRLRIAMEDPEKEARFMQELTKMIMDLRMQYTLESKSTLGNALPVAETPVTEAAHPEFLKHLFKPAIPRGGDEKMSVDEILDVCRQVIKYSVKTGHPNFHNQLFGGIDTYALGGSWLGDALNTSMYTFEMAPVFNIVEEAVLDWMLELVGWKDKEGPRRGEGIFTAGGSMANMYAMSCARHKRNPRFKEVGMAGCDPFVIFTSDQSHYSIKKSANWLGFGTDNVKVIGTDIYGRMDTDELKQAIMSTTQKGIKVPLMVCATFGTTVLGAIDPIEDISDICKEFDVWLHVDACWGGSLLACHELNYMTACLTKADSISWNPHKMLGAPLQTSVVLIKEQFDMKRRAISHDLLKECNAASAAYLFQASKHYDTSYDTGDSSIQCGRRPDSFNLWLMLKARGEKYFSDAILNAINKIKLFNDHLDILPDNAERVIENFDISRNINVCFFLFPRFTTKDTAPKQDPKFRQFMNAVPTRAKGDMVKRGKIMISHQALPEKAIGNCFRMVATALPKPTDDSMYEVLDELWSVVKDYSMTDKEFQFNKPKK